MLVLIFYAFFLNAFSNDYLKEQSLCEELLSGHPSKPFTHFQFHDITPFQGKNLFELFPFFQRNGKILKHNDAVEINNEIIIKYLVDNAFGTHFLEITKNGSTNLLAVRIFFNEHLQITSITTPKYPLPPSSYFSDILQSSKNSQELYSFLKNIIFNLYDFKADKSHLLHRRQISDSQDGFFVEQTDYAILKAGSTQYKALKSFGAGPCVIISLYDQTNKVGFLAHIDAPRFQDLENQLKYRIIPEFREQGGMIDDLSQFPTTKNTKNTLQITIVGGEEVDFLSAIIPILQKIPHHSFRAAVLTHQIESAWLDLDTGEIAAFSPRYEYYEDLDLQQLSQKIKNPSFRLNKTLP